MGEKPGDSLDAAGRALRHRDLSAGTLEARLVKAGISEPEARATVERLVAAGLVDDLRLASLRARALACRGQGDLMIDARLEQEGFGREIRAEAVAQLDPEAARVLPLLAGASRSERRKAAARLGRRGFATDAVESALARLDVSTDAELR